MSRLENTIFIDRPIEDVWAFLVDPSHLPAWCPEAEQVRQPSREPLRRGTTIAVSVRVGLLRMTTHLEVTALEEHRTIELRSVAGALGGSVVVRVDVQAANGLTRLTQTSGVGGVPGMLGALGPDRRTSRIAFFAALKRRLEEQTGALSAAEPPQAASAQRPDVSAASPVDQDPVADTGADAAWEPATASQVRPAEPQGAEPTVHADPGPAGDATLAERPTIPEGPTAANAPAAADVPAAAASSLATESITVTDSTVAADSTAGTESSVVEDPTGAVDSEVGPRPAAEPGTTAAQAAREGLRHDQPVETPAPEPSPKTRTTADPAGRRTRRDRPVHVGPLVLRFETERGPAPTFEVARSGATIGRAPENTIRLDDLSVSRRHARISFRHGGYWLNDLKSTSGTWIDGTKLNAPHRLADGQIVGIGILRLRALLPTAHEDIPESGEEGPPAEELAGQERLQR